MQGSTAFIDSAKVMAKGQVTIPADVRKALGVGEGDRVSFVVDGKQCPARERRRLCHADAAKRNFAAKRKKSA